MAVDPNELNKYNGKRVTIKQVGKDEAVEGTVEFANELGILFKPKGTSVANLVEASELESIDFVETDTKALEAAVLQPIEFGRARRHLADRHGYKLSEVNELTEAQALEIHNEIDHEGLGLSHVHKAKEQGTAAQAVEAQADAA